MLVSSLEAFERLAALPASANEVVHRLVAAHWPGALTIVVEASEQVPPAVLRDGTTVGIRMPDNADALAIIDGAGGALAVTSANRSGEVEARSADEVHAKLGGRIDYVVDGGPSPGGQPSTVVDATRNTVRVLRHGAIPQWQITSVLNGAG